CREWSPRSQCGGPRGARRPIWCGVPPRLGNVRRLRFAMAARETRECALDVRGWCHRRHEQGVGPASAPDPEGTPVAALIGVAVTSIGAATVRERPLGERLMSTLCDNFA